MAAIVSTYIDAHTLGLSLLCSKICLLCFLEFPQFSAYYACFYAFQKCIMLLFCVSSNKRSSSYDRTCRNEKCHFNFQHTKSSNSLKLGCAPEFVGILEQWIWRQICSPLEALDILLSNIFVVSLNY